MTDADSLAYQELHHRCSNDLQMIVALLHLEARRCECEIARELMMETANRVQVLAAARMALAEPGRMTINAILGRTCAALQAMAEARGVMVKLELHEPVPVLTEGASLAAAVAVNELATNCLKHAFAEDTGGKVTIVVQLTAPDCLSITVDDDGAAFPESTQNPKRSGSGLGLTLARRTLATQDGLLIAPESGSKQFTIRMPVEVERQVYAAVH